MGTYKLEWEGIDKWSDRLKVPGGWIVRSGGSGYDVHHIFIKDEYHVCVEESQQEIGVTHLPSRESDFK